jgi:hypothetical protein
MDGADTEIEIRQVYEMEDFPMSDTSKEAHEKLRLAFRTD